MLLKHPSHAIRLLALSTFLLLIGGILTGVFFSAGNYAKASNSDFPRCSDDQVVQTIMDLQNKVLAPMNSVFKMLSNPAGKNYYANLPSHIDFTINNISEVRLTDGARTCTANLALGKTARNALKLPEQNAGGKHWAAVDAGQYMPTSTSITYKIIRTEAHGQNIGYAVQLLDN
ncbi:MAG TPA: hypothetical protein VM755_05155 [Stellaceae bacterium]|nr:hypothetical protein [Stellaceae bacterium]